MLAEMISEAVTACSKPMSRRQMQEYAKMVRAEAAEWLASDSHGMFSLIWACEKLGVDPDDVRAWAIRKGGSL